MPSPIGSTSYCEGWCAPTLFCFNRVQFLDSNVGWITFSNLSLLRAEDFLHYCIVTQDRWTRHSRQWSPPSQPSPIKGEGVTGQCSNTLCTHIVVQGIIIRGLLKPRQASSPRFLSLWVYGFMGASVLGDFPHYLICHFCFVAVRQFDAKYPSYLGLSNIWRTMK